MPETEFERERRLLREQEGRNLANYEVILSALIRSRLEYARVLIFIACAGIALLVFVALNGVYGKGQAILMAVAFMAFLLTLIKAIGRIERNTEQLSLALKGQSDREFGLTAFGRGPKRLAIIGVVGVVMFGFTLFVSPQMVPVIGKKEPAKADPEPVKTDAVTDQIALNKVEPVLMTAQVDAEKPLVAVASAGPAGKISGNGGNFRGGTAH